jgi:hypothetical protein
MRESCHCEPDRACSAKPSPLGRHFRPGVERRYSEQYVATGVGVWMEITRGPCSLDDGADVPFADTFEVTMPAAGVR